MTAVCLDGAEAEHDGSGNDGKRANDDFGDVLAACAFEFAKEGASPEDADDGKSVGDGPEHSGEDGDGNQMAVFGKIGKDIARALEHCGDGPASCKDSGDHAEGDGIGREAGVDELGGSFGSTEPDSGGEGAEDTEAVNRGKDYGRIGSSCGAHSIWDCPFLRP